MSLDEYSVKNMFKAFSAKTFIDNILFNEENSDKAIKYLSTFGKSIDFIHTLELQIQNTNSYLYSTSTKS